MLVIKNAECYTRERLKIVQLELKHKIMMKDINLESTMAKITRMRILVQVHQSIIIIMIIIPHLKSSDKNYYHFCLNRVYNRGKTLKKFMAYKFKEI